jgi:glycosyltransferase involved in cell wall biosynthesis
MRIAFVSTYPPQTCGLASYTQDLVAGLVACDPSLAIDVVAERGALSSDSMPVWPCFDGEGDYVGAILDRLDRVHADVVHVQHEYGIFGVDQRFHELLAGIRRQQRVIVVTLHPVHTALSFDRGCSWRPQRTPMVGVAVERYQRDIGALADVVIVHQEAPIREVLVRQGLTEGAVVTIPHGTRVTVPPARNEARALLGISPDSAVLVAFGYFEPAKNYPVLIEAVSLMRVARPDVRLLVGAYVRYPVPETMACRDQCEKLAAELGVVANITFLDDRVADGDLEALLAAADVACFVYNEDTRSSSGALHRAVGCGVPVVASRIPKFAEVVEISDELLADARSPQQVARLLERLLSDSEFRSYARRRGNDFAAATSWDRVAQRHLSVYALAVQRAVGVPVMAPPGSRASPP